MVPVQTVGQEVEELHQGDQAQPREQGKNGTRPTRLHSIGTMVIKAHSWVAAEICIEYYRTKIHLSIRVTIL